MKRVLSSALQSGTDGKLRHRDSPLTGLAYDVAADGIVGPISVVDDGTKVGTSSDWINVPPGGSRVAFSSLDQYDDYGPFYFRGVRFTGIAYFFASGGECTGESEYIDGRWTQASERSWYLTGEPEEVVGGGEYTAWFQDGRLKCRTTGSGVLYSLTTDDDGRLGAITLNDAALFDLAGVSRMAFADDLMLLGNAIDTNFLRILRDNTKLDAVTKLRLIRTRVDSAGIAVIASLAGLAAVKLKGNPALGLAEAQEIKRQRPSCAVELDGVALP